MVLGTTTASSTAQIPAGARVLSCQFEVTTVYDGGTTIDIGDGVTSNLIMDQSDIVETKLGTYLLSQDTNWTTGNAVTVTITGGPAAGAGVALIEYAEPEA
jgi:hypothetical protein